jgi:hypothetical protein
MGTSSCITKTLRDESLGIYNELAAKSDKIEA